MPKTTPQNVEHLRKFGPTPVNKLPGGEVNISDKERGVVVFKLPAGSTAARSQGGATENVAYLMEDHDPERVVREMLMANPKLLDNLTLAGLTRRFSRHGPEFKKAAQRVLAETDIENPNENRGGVGGGT